MCRRAHTFFSYYIKHLWYPDGTDVALDNVIVSVAGVPEAETWAMLIAGFGAIGAAQRRRRSVTIAA